MLHLRSLRESLPLFRALGSDVRIRILETVAQNGPLHMSAIASAVGITDGALTPHIKMLEDCGLLSIEVASGAHGVQKVCRIKEERILVETRPEDGERSVFETEIGVGQYTAYEVYPTCGLATGEHLIGEVDDPRHFASPERTQADILWFGSGYVEYMVPNFLTASQELLEIQLSMELCSEAPGSAEHWPSDIHFHINGRPLGFWTSPADFGETPGVYNPKWWFRGWNQHGLFKLLSVNKSGTFIDGMRISGVRIGDLNVEGSPNINFRLSVPETAGNVGGLTVFGRSFGNYHQDIKVRMSCRNKAPNTARR
ncbi:MAG: winged helix-turn-helix transcriptional regulator [Clostridiales bacterium]|nr:winged helix-turn-helix transcriptional regulator [Clostridiales bacterium]